MGKKYFKIWDRIKYLLSENVFGNHTWLWYETVIVYKNDKGIELFVPFEEKFLNSDEYKLDAYEYRVQCQNCGVKRGTRHYL